MASLSRVSAPHLSRRALLGGSLAVVALGPLLGCNETLGGLSGSSGTGGVPVALVSLEGAPDAITGRLGIALTAEAQRRGIVLVAADATPRYRLRGYLAPVEAEAGRAALSWRLDVFDERLQRSTRLGGAEPMATRADDPWTIVTERDLTQVAAAAMEGLATYLRDSPAVMAGAAGRPLPAAALLGVPR